MNRCGKHDVYWHIPNRKKPIVDSTVSTSRAIVDFGRDGSTIQQLRDKFTNKELVAGYEITAVLDAYIQRGYGDWIIKEHFS